MDIITIAGIKIGLDSPDTMKWDCVEQFQERKKCKPDVIMKIILGELPVCRDGQLVFENSTNKIYFGMREKWHYHRLKVDGDWEFCLTVKENQYTLTGVKQEREYLSYVLYVLSQIDLQSILLRKRVGILHSSYIIYQNQGIVFTAPSGTGKSTQAALWEKYRGAEIINGDRAAIGIKNGKMYVFGIPFSGSSAICKNREAPLRAVVILEKGKNNQISRLKTAEAVRYLYSQIAVQRWNAQEIQDIFEILEEIAACVPIVKLSCLPDEGAVMTLDHYLKELEE